MTGTIDYLARLGEEPLSMMAHLYLCAGESAQEAEDRDTQAHYKAEAEMIAAIAVYRFGQSGWLAARDKEAEAL